VRAIQQYYRDTAIYESSNGGQNVFLRNVYLSESLESRD
jgi:hypothetical protein